MRVVVFVIKGGSGSNTDNVGVDGGIGVMLLELVCWQQCECYSNSGSSGIEWYCDGSESL